MLQVHQATLLDGRKVAVKVQYPGVAQGIDSDIDNLISVLNVGNLFPKGLFLEQFVAVYFIYIFQRIFKNIAYKVL